MSYCFSFIKWLKIVSFKCNIYCKRFRVFNTWNQPTRHTVPPYTSILTVGRAEFTSCSRKKPFSWTVPKNVVKFLTLGVTCAALPKFRFSKFQFDTSNETISVEVVKSVVFVAPHFRVVLLFSFATVINAYLDGPSFSVVLARAKS